MGLERSLPVTAEGLILQTVTDATPQRSEKRAQTHRQHRNRRPSVHAGSLRFRDCLTKDDRVSKEESHLCDSRILQSANSEIKQVLRYKCSGKLPKDDQRSCASVYPHSYPSHTTAERDTPDSDPAVHLSSPLSHTDAHRKRER